MPAEPQRTPSESSEDRSPFTRNIRVVGEAVLAFLAAATVWPFGCVDDEWKFVVSGLVLLLSIAWILRCGYYRRLSLRPDLITMGLGGLVCVSAIQLIPLPLGVVSILSPRTAEAYRAGFPDLPETMPGEAATARPGWVALSVDPALTTRFLADVFLVLVVYAIVRNWIASRGSFRRFAWVVAVNGTILALYATTHHFSSSSRFIFWTFEAPSPYGPFVCRNHYPFYAYLCLGLTVGLLLNLAKSDYHPSSGRGIKKLASGLATWFGSLSQNAAAVIVFTMAALMAVSIPFSLSRGGIVSLIVAALGAALLARTVRGSRDGLDPAIAAGSLVAMLALGLGAWYGWGSIERRLTTLADVSELADNRGELWADAATIIGRYPILGSGSNTFIRVEPQVRPKPTGDAILFHDSVHNEYLEAWAEGGPLRLIFTLAIAWGAVSAAARAFVRLKDRSGGSLALGAFFGLLAVALHSVFDFGIHIPSIALLAAAVAGFVTSAADDPDFQPTRKMKTSSSAEAVSTSELGTDRPNSRARAVSLIGPPAFAGLAVVLLTVSLAVIQYRTWDLAERYRLAAVRAERSDSGDRFQRRVELLTARAMLIPRDGDAQDDLARAHFDAALATLPKPLPPQQSWKSLLSAETVEKHIGPGLRATFVARAASPLLPHPHLRLALYRDFLTTAEPAAAYYARAIRLIPTDPEIHYAAGVEAFERGDLDAAAQHWKKSLSLSGRQLNPIVKVAIQKLTPDQIRDRILPDEPTVLIAAADTLYPNRATQLAQRKPFLDRAAAILEGSKSQKTAHLVALAQVYMERNDKAAAMDAWRSAVASAPADANLRTQYALWLEQEELVEPLIIELEWLREQGRGGSNIRDRIEAARHAAHLKRQIDN